MGPQDVVYFSGAMTVFLLGMGLINPLGTAITLQPFGRQAGAASALLGFLQMMCAAAAIGLAALLPWSVYGAFCAVLTANLSLAVLSFRGAALDRQLIDSERSGGQAGIKPVLTHKPFGYVKWPPYFKSKLNGLPVVFPAVQSASPSLAA